jgi:PAS domain S-box-containing protein
MAARSLKSLIGASLFTLAVLPVAIVALVSNILLGSTVDRGLGLSMKALVASAAHEAATSLDLASRALDLLAAGEGSSGGLAEGLANALGLNPELGFLLLSDTGRRPVIVWPRDGGESLASLAALIPPPQGGEGAAEPLVSGPFVDKEGEGYLSLSRSSGGRRGIVTLRTRGLASFFSTLRLSSRDELALVDGQGRLLVASGDKGKEVEEASLVRAALASPFRVLGKERGDRAMAAPIPGWPLFALYICDESLHTALNDGLALRLGLLVLVACLATLAFGILFRRALQRPFGDLLARMEAVTGSEDLGRVGGQWPAEFLSIVEAFNLMAEHLGHRELALQQSEARYRTLFDGGLIPALIIDPEKASIRSANPAAVAYYGYEAGEMVDLGAEQIFMAPIEEIREALDQTGRGRRNRFNFRHRLKCGVICDVEVYGSPIEIDGRLQIYCFIFDVTERRIAREELQRALDEKVILLKEIHHRVKNNLQIVASLLNLQLQYIHDPADIELFKMSQNRVYSMSLTHELLYQAADLSSVDMSEYGQRLVSYLREGQIGSEIRISTDFAGFALPLDKAMPCGLALNELVTNAIKYARPLEGDEPIRVRMTIETTEGESRVLLQVIDSGPGLPQGLNPHRPSSLGFSLLQSLAAQLEGEVGWQPALPGRPRPGTMAAFSFTCILPTEEGRAAARRLAAEKTRRAC